MDKIFLIDGHAQIFRMYYAFMRRPMINSKGMDTSILFGFTKMLLELINKEHPTHIAVAFDPPVKTFRHEAYPLYKANRSAAPELVKMALNPLQEILKAFDISVVMVNGFEADDVIGSMAKQWEGIGRNIYMVTPDKDYGQLVSDHVFQYKPAKGGNDFEIIGPEQICANYGICRPEQVIDILTIWGDSSDNVPGVRGIGEIGAKKLMGKYGSINNIIKHLDELPVKQKEGFEEFGEQLEMSRFLVTIKTDINLPAKLDEIRIKSPDMRKVSEIFEKYEFNSLKRLLPDQAASYNSKSNSQTNRDFNNDLFAGANSDSLQIKEKKTQPEYKVEESEFEKLYEAAKKCGDLAIIQDESGLRLTTAITENKKKTDTFLSFHTNGEYSTYRSLLEEKEIKKTGYDLKSIIKLLAEENIELGGTLHDIEIMHYLINPERTHKENFLIKQYLDIDLESTAGSGPVNTTVPDLFSAQSPNTDAEREEDLILNEQQKKRELLECALLIPLGDKIESELIKNSQDKLYVEMEMPLIPVLADMERQGFKIDTEHLKNYSMELTSEMEKIEDHIRRQANEPTVNLSSPKQVGLLLFEKLKIDPKIKKSAKGNYPTDEETLNSLKKENPIVEEILEYRELKKLLSTYIDNFPGLISPKSGKIHTTFNQALTSTGRLSSNNPNLQNIPIRSERGKEIRKAFIPSSPDGYIVSADYSQIELRLMAHMSGDEHLIAAFNSGGDVHTATAAKVFKVEESEVTREQRSRAKVANFGIIYGISAFGLSQRLGMNRSDSKALIEQYFESYPGVKEYMKRTIENGRIHGFVETIYGRKRFLPDINSRNANVRNFNERNAINAPLQGSAADIIKMAMIGVWNKLKENNLKSKLILQVHDELVIDTVAEELQTVCDIVKREMESVITLKVPLTAECGYGKNWLEAH